MYFILSNPLIVLLVLTVIMMSLMFLFVGRKKKTKKVQKVFDKQEEKKSEDLSVSEDNNVNKQTTDDILDKPRDYVEKIVEDEKDSSLKDKKISKVYVRKINSNEKSEETKNNPAEEKYDELINRAEFVKKSKTISRLNRFKTENEIPSEIESENIDVETNGNIQFLSEKKSKFNQRRRLSEIIKSNNFDDLFASHIADAYLNIDSSRHLSKKFEQDVYKRSEELIQNGLSRALDPEKQEQFNSLKNDKDKLRLWLEESKMKANAVENSQNNNEVNYESSISMKNMILAEMLLKRKKYKK